MAKPRTSPRKAPAASSPPEVDIMNDLVRPAFEREIDPSDEENAGIDQMDEDPLSGQSNVMYACLRGEHIVHARVSRVDDIRSTVHMSLMTGYMIADSAAEAMMVGNLLHPTSFHVRTDVDLGCYGRICVDCDIVVRADDGPLVERRLSELLQLGEGLQWYFPLRIPNHLGWQEITHMEMEWAELPLQELEGFLRTGMDSPPSERTPITLLRVAQGLGRWQDVIRLLREHPRELPAKQWAPLKCTAYRQMGRWLPAIRAAKEGGIRNGRYPGSKWLSPSYLHALVMGGDEIEALRLLGEPKCGEPDFYDWLRAIALRQAGDTDQAYMCFHRYMNVWSGDVLGCNACRDLIPDEEEPTE